MKERPIMDGKAFEGLYAAVTLLFWVAVIAVPLGFWKMVDIVIWIWSHISIN